MRILLLTRSFNSLTQRLYVELATRGHEVSVEFDIADSVTEEAVALFRPDLVVAPFLKRAIPESVWRAHLCLIVHPGIVGDRGPSALDWAIQDGEAEWGVTVLQAEAEMDAGPVWAGETFPMRAATKSSLYRGEVTEAAVRAVLEAIERFASGSFVPQRVAPGAPGVRGRSRPLLKQQARAIDWQRDDTAAVLRKIAAADGVPGVLDSLFGVPCFLYDAHPAAAVPAAAGSVAARGGRAVLRATTDGAVWIGHCRRADRDGALKLPVALAFAGQWQQLPPADGYAEIRYAEHGPVGVLHFPFYNGAMSTVQCEELLAAYRAALARPTRALVLAGGPEFFSNGISLTVIEAADSPADESWRNIVAMDEVCRAVLETTDRITVAALQGNAGAGGCFLAFACDRVWARAGVILNPHYKNMGNLYGSEYWTYTLPRRVRQGEPRAVMENRLPVGGAQAARLGLVDRLLDAGRDRFLAQVLVEARALVEAADFDTLIAAKRARRAADEAQRPLAAYRDEELANMRRNFYGFDPSYHYARAHFVGKVPHAWTPLHLARHRRKGAV
ncbi:MAG: hydrogenase maturation protein [Burkholderiales bacterium]|nr:hydrogenase maturation protein [Burkholderiales bacterium]